MLFRSISMNGSWSQSGRYEKAIIDNVSFLPSVNSEIISNPTFYPSEGNFTSPQQITLSTFPADATIRYTLDGSTPTETVGIIYTEAFQISSTKTVKAIAYKPGWTNSQISTATYVITGTVATPTIEFDSFIPGAEGEFGNHTQAIAITRDDKYRFVGHWGDSQNDPILIYSNQNNSLIARLNIGRCRSEERRVGKECKYPWWAYD